MTLFGITLAPPVLALVLMLAIAAIFFAPFLLLTGNRPLRGRSMLGVVVALFGVIICVNIFMAVTAVRSFPGLETPNSYVASQNFDRERAAQEALGWRAEPVYADGQLRLRISDAEGRPAPVQTLQVTVSRPTQKRDDVTPEMRYQGDLWVADLPLAPGAWVVHLEARAPDGTLFRQRLAGYPGSMVKG
ncbi:MAG: FixH family protein [Paracoccus sp. (in: a-proteobacteria)]|nr:FixH family protein [Paracoccus sp. (in: a-proteobacteria)]